MKNIFIFTFIFKKDLSAHGRYKILSLWFRVAKSESAFLESGSNQLNSYGSGPRRTKYGSGTLTCTWKEKVGAWLAPSAWTTRYVGVIPRDWNLSYKKSYVGVFMISWLCHYQCCGCGLIISGSVFTKFDECGSASGSRAIKLPNWFFYMRTVHYLAVDCITA